MELSPMDYLSQDDIKEICIDELRSKVRESLRYYEASDILSNVSYKCVFKEVEDIIKMSEDEIKKQINDKVVEIISKLSNYCVFRSKDEYDRSDSLAQKYLLESIENNKQLIEDRVKELMVNFNVGYMKEDLQDKIYEVVTERLFGKDE